MFDDKVSVTELVSLRDKLDELIIAKKESFSDAKLKNKDVAIIVQALIEEKKKVEEIYRDTLQIGRTLSSVVGRLDSLKARGIW